VKLTFDDSVEVFREEVVAWIAANRPSAEEMRADPALSSAHVPEWCRAWIGRQFDAGLLVPGWPPELGGRGASAVETLVYVEELNRIGVPRHTNPQGFGIIVPSIIDYGTPEQVEHYAMPILRGELPACLGMSEPGAGSDLAALSTRAVLDGDRFLVDGQKVWTSGANYADVCFLFCRTDPTAPKHKGISILLVDMATPGITVRPLPEIIHPHTPDLNEVFLSDVEVPAENLVGTMNAGWAMASGSLAHERGMVWLLGVMTLEAAMVRALEEGPEALSALAPQERAVAADHLVTSYIDTVASRCLGYRGFAKLQRGGSAPEQALMKAFTSEALQRLAASSAELLGERALDLGRGDRELVDRRDGAWIERYFESFSGTISAGSSEIQRNIIAEKVLGLPRG
jgi:alkylation response protein AidB-like acyl-CoA dehydrogenase